MVASSSCPGDVAVAVLGMRHLLVLLVSGMRCSCTAVLVSTVADAVAAPWVSGDPSALGIVQRGHYVVTLNAAKCSRVGPVRPSSGRTSLRRCLGGAGAQRCPVGLARG